MFTDDDLYREHLKQRAAEADTSILPGMYVRWKDEYKPEKADWHVGQADLINYSTGWAEVLVYDDASREFSTFHVALKALEEDK